MMRKVMILAALLATACADKEQAAEGPPPDTAGGRADFDHPDVGAKVMVTLSDSGVALSQDSVAMVGSGQITLAIENKAAQTQDLEINGGSAGTWKSTPIPPGQTVLMSMLMARGSYDLNASLIDSAGTSAGPKGKLRIY